MMTMPAELARAWDPMWHPNAHIPRPWWRVMDTFPWGYVRVDGWRVERASSGGIFNEPPGGTFAEMPGITFISDGLAYVDTNHPLPAPDPMPGQVWATATATHSVCYSLTTGDGRGYVAYDDKLTGLHLVRSGTWPPPGAVLVAGPTPWGRDVPWAPMGGA